MKALLIAIATLMSAPAMSDRYVAGDFNGWNPAGNLMTEVSPGFWSVDLTALTPGRHEFKVTNGTWTENWPWSGNSWLIADPAGSVTVTYDATTSVDGWLNATKRLGVNTDPGTWTAVGDWQGWDNANPATAMAPIGGGVYYLQTMVPAQAAPYQYKAVVTGSWDAIGSDARSVNANAVQFTVTPDRTQWGFWVDALKGIIKARSLPESPVNIDGMAIPGDFVGLLRSTQANPTAFGDNTGEPTGSELDGLYVARGSTAAATEGVFIGVTGNLETNGNAYVIFVDTAPGSGRSNIVSALAGPDALTGLNGAALDYGFAPTHAITVNNQDGTTYVDLTDLTVGVNTYLGSSRMDSGIGELEGGSNPNGALASFHNGNLLGVTSDPGNIGDASTATKGLELFIPFVDLGIDPNNAASIYVMAILCKAGGAEGSYISNQTLPGLGGGYPSDSMPRGGPALDFSLFPGDQHMLADISTPLADPIVVDGQDVPAPFGSSIYVLQDNHTGWGDKVHELGSELDQLFAVQDSGSLLLGITGNLRTNGDFWLVFLQAGAGGSGVLNVPGGAGPPSGVLQGLSGTAFDAGFAPTHVLCINTIGGSCYADMVDLRTGASRFLGSIGVGAGSGYLGSDNPLGAQVAFDNSNVAGVTAESAADPATATTGAEISLPLGYIPGASCAGEVKLMAWLVSGKGDVSSNQTLPPLPVGASNLGAPVDFTALAGDQFVTLPISAGAFTPVASVDEARTKANGTAVLLRARVSAALQSGTFYIQDKSSVGGLAVVGAPPAPPAGSLVEIRGYIATEPGYGLRSIETCGVRVLEPPSGVVVRPIGMGSGAVGGAAVGANPGITGAAGANNLGSLISVWGQITDVGSVTDAFYIDDGAGLQDGTLDLGGAPIKGIRVFPVPGGLSVGSYVTVTGISTFWVEYPPGGAPVNHRAVQLVGEPVVYLPQ